jgi:pyruvate/2-oxoglutarate dehydrogenase complex dihydrolipoamide acyltransferase (E2) component
MDRVGKYEVKPFSKYRQNIVLVTKEGWRKRSHHTILEIDVTKSRKLIKKYKIKTGESISFTGWIIKCIGQAISENKIFNAYRQGRKKIVIFEDIDIAIAVEKSTENEERPRVYIIRKVNEKSIFKITQEIRKAQEESANKSTELLGENLIFIERFVLKSPIFLKKLLIMFLRGKGVFKKKYMGVTSVTAIGMKGRFPGTVIPLGGPLSNLFVVGGIVKKPWVVKNKIVPREILNLTLTVDHDLIDGGPLVRFVDRLCELMENAYNLDKIDK